MMFLLFQGCSMKDEKKEENVSIVMDTYDRRPSTWFRESFGSMGPKDGKISKAQFIRASIDVGVGVYIPRNEVRRKCSLI